MPTVRPRIYVTLDDDLADAIRRIGLGTGMSQSAVIAQMLSKQRQALLSLGDAMDKARSLQGPLSGALAAVLGRSENDLEGMRDEAMQELDALHLVLDEAMEEQGVEPPRRSPAGEERGGGAAHSQHPPKPQGPPPFNKGVRSAPKR